MGPGSFYSMFKLDGRNVGAAYTVMKEQTAGGMPPNWMVYVATENADLSQNRAAELGGAVCKGAFDVFDAGRMAVLQDPTGATFSVWQPNRHHGIQITGVSGALCWVELSTPDPDRAKTFYEGLFGWNITTSELDSSGYLHIANGEQMIGGVQPPAHRDAGLPPHWLAYIQVTDCDAAAEKATHLGGDFSPASDNDGGVGRFAVVGDPQGAVFAIFQPLPRTIGS